MLSLNTIITVIRLARWEFQTTIYNGDSYEDVHRYWSGKEVRSANELGLRTTNSNLVQQGRVNMATEIHD